jgi:outer membrane protein with beta-barrel domain
MRIHTLTVVVCLVAGVSIASAQDPAQGGVIGGPGWSNLTLKTAGQFPDFSSRTGMMAGAYIVTPTRRGIGLEPEVLVTIKGANAAQDGIESSLRLTSLEFPVLLRLAARPAQRKTTFLALVGPTFGFPLSARRSDKLSGSTEDEDVSDQLEGFELGLTAGAGFEVGRLRIDGRFTWGLTHLNNDTSGETSIKSRMFTVLAGVRLW